MGGEGGECEGVELRASGRLSKRSMRCQDVWVFLTRDINVWVCFFMFANPCISGVAALAQLAQLNCH